MSSGWSPIKGSTQDPADLRFWAFLQQRTNPRNILKGPCAESQERKNQFFRERSVENILSSLKTKSLERIQISNQCRSSGYSLIINVCCFWKEGHEILTVSFFLSFSINTEAGRERWSLKGSCSAAECQAFPGLTWTDPHGGSGPQSQRWSVPRTRPSQEIMISEGASEEG